MFERRDTLGMVISEEEIRRQIVTYKKTLGYVKHKLELAHFQAANRGELSYSVKQQFWGGEPIKKEGIRSYAQKKTLLQEDLAIEDA